MRKVRPLLPILMLVMSHSARAQDSAEPDLKTSGRLAHKLKSVELADTYKIQVPESVEVDKGGGHSVPAYTFRSYHPHYIAVDVMVLPYSSTVAKYGLVSVNEETGLFELPFSINGSFPLTAYFRISEGNYAYYGWSTSDSAYACTMNSPCPVKTKRNSRYYTVYTFVVFDKGRDSIVQFIAYYFGPSENVKGFKGRGKLLREVIVPSLKPIH